MSNKLVTFLKKIYTDLFVIPPPEEKLTPTEVLTLRFRPALYEGYSHYHDGRTPYFLAADSDVVAGKEKGQAPFIIEWKVNTTLNEIVGIDIILDVNLENEETTEPGVLVSLDEHSQTAARLLTGPALDEYIKDTARVFSLQ
jgi:hypothetical protein